MPLDKYLSIKIDNQELDIEPADKLDISISYALEDRDNIQQKNSSNSFDIVAPATLRNDRVANSYTNPGAEDMTTDEIFKGNRKGVIEVNGQQLLKGKAFLISAKHADKPKGYNYNFYGDNADWIIDLKEVTLFDLLKDITFLFTKAHIMDTWNFDGTDPDIPYVFAPVRYGDPMDTLDVTSGSVTDSKEDYSMKPEYMKPSLSKYWIIYRAFKSLGYKVSSEFFDLPYFRRQVMPWTWGNFLFSDGTRLDNLDFLAKSTESKSEFDSTTKIWDLDVSNDSINGAFDNNGSYSWDSSTKEMRWIYLIGFNYGNLDATFHLQMFVDAHASGNSDVELRVQYYKNGVKFTSHDDNVNGTLLLNLDAPAIGRRDYIGIIEDWVTIPVSPGDIITAKIYLHIFDTDLGNAYCKASVDAFELDYFRVPLGGTINFENFPAFKKYKFLDFLAGVVDEFDIAFKTDSVNKVVYFEPLHPYSLVDDQSVKSGGYINGNILDWENKHDITKESEMELFSAHERELTFRYKEDTSDGSAKVIQDRNASVVASAKYVFPDRFKSGTKEIENRFFSAVVHYDVSQWKGISINPDIVPQMICLIPENISNTSRDEAQNTFLPKSAYYKGIIPDIRWVFDGITQNDYPYMFAVNYMKNQDGVNDPVLSYCDENVGDDLNPIIAKGLVRRFYLQRLAIMRNGQYYRTYFKLNDNDIANFLHREFVICRGQKWEVINISNYFPLREESTEVYLRKFVPIKSA